MKKLTFLFFAFGLLSSASYGQIAEGQIAFGGTQAEQATSIVQTRSGGYATAGYTSSYGSGFYQVYVANFDSKGLLKWAKAIGGTGLDYGYGITQALDGGFVVTGYTNSFATGIEDVYVIKLDSLGNIKWTESIGGANAEQGKCIITTKDGGYAIGGYTGSYGAGGPGDFYIIKLDASGAVKWTKTIGGGGDEEAYTIIQTKDGGYALSGYTLSFGAGNADVYVAKVDSVGNLQWTRTVGGPLGDAGFGICQTFDGGYAVTGYEAESSFGAGSDDMYVIRLDAGGAVRWTKTIGGTGNDQGQSILETKDRGLVVAGFTTSFGAGGFDVYLVKLDSLGNKLWDKATGGPGNEQAQALIQTADHGFAVAGYSDNYGAGMDDFFLVKYDSAGNTCGSSEAAGGIVGTGGTYGTGGTASSGGTINFKDSGRIVESGILDTICRTMRKPSAVENISANLGDVKVYPNPSSGKLNVDLSDITINTDLNLEITDITGRVLISTNVHNFDNVLTFDVSSFSPGMYFMRLSSGTASEVKKFIKE